MSDYQFVDAWVNTNFGPPSDDIDVSYLFPGLAERWERGTTLEQLVDEMDASNVGRAVLSAGYGGPDDLPWVIKAVEKHPDRFVGSVVVDPRRGMDAVRELEDLALISSSERSEGTATTADS